MTSNPSTQGHEPIGSDVVGGVRRFFDCAVCGQPWPCTHPGPFWIDKAKRLRVCDRHRSQYEERADEFGPFEWEKADD